MYRMDKCRGAQDVRERPRTADKVVNSRLGGRGDLNKSITCIACHFRFLSKYAVFLGHPRTGWYKSGTRYRLNPSILFLFTHPHGVRAGNLPYRGPCGTYRVEKFATNVAERTHLRPVGRSADCRWCIGSFPPWRSCLLSCAITREI